MPPPPKKPKPHTQILNYSVIIGFISINPILRILILVHIIYQTCKPSEIISSPCKKDSVGIKKAAAIIPSMVMNFRNQNLSEDEENTCCVSLFIISNSINLLNGWANISYIFIVQNLLWLVLQALPKIWLTLVHIMFFLLKTFLSNFLRTFNNLKKKKKCTFFHYRESFCAMERFHDYSRFFM